MAGPDLVFFGLCEAKGCARGRPRDVSGGTPRWLSSSKKTMKSLILALMIVTTRTVQTGGKTLASTARVPATPEPEDVMVYERQ